MAFSEGSTRRTVRSVDLTETLIPAPQGVKVPPGHFAVLTYPDNGRFVYTLGIITCKGIVFNDASSRKALLCHLMTTGNLPRTIDYLVQTFGGDLTRSDVYLIGGMEEAQDFPIEGEDLTRWPTMQQVQDEILRHNHQGLELYFRYDPGMALWTRHPI